MALTGIANTARTMSYYTRMQEVVTNNLANSSTEGFKADRITAHLVGNAPHPVAVETTDMRQGAFRDTGRALDLSLDGPGFFVVQTPHGDRLVRGGSFRLDPAGKLIDHQGNAVLGTHGPLVLNGSSVEVRNDGSVLVDGTSVGNLRLETADPATLSKEGANQYVARGALRPVTDTTTVRQGSIEEPNLDPVSSMVDLVTIQRAYAANADALRAMDGVLSTVTSEVGRLP